MAANSVNSNNSIPQSGVSSVPQSATSINSQHGPVLGNVQILNQSQVLSAADLQSGKIQVLKRKATDSGGPMVAKVFIQKGSSGQPQAIPASQVQQSQQIIMTSMPTALVNSSHSLVTQTQTVVTQGIQGFSAHQGPVTPTKTITLSQSGIISMPGTPTKQIIPLSGGKIPISPMKSPTKIMIPVPLSKTPQKIAPAPNQVIHMVKNDTLTTVTTGTSNASKPATYTMSPSKVIIHKQPGNAGGKTSLISPMNNNVVTSSTVTKQLFLPISSGATNVQPMQVAGSKFPYVRLVTAPTSHASGAVTRTATATPQQAKPIAPALSSGSSGGQYRSVSVNQGQQVLPKLSGAQAQRVLLPATSQVQIRPTVNSGSQSGNSSSLAQFPPGTTIISSGGQNLQGVQGFAIVPAQYVEQLQQTMGGQQVLQQPPPKQEASFLPGPASTHTASSNKQASSTSEGNSQRQRKPCNCTKSQCLKLYCDCFANGEFCSNCNCQNCFNNLEHEDERSRAIKACLDRNPMAFHPKIGKGRNGEDRRHNKGCNCKRSGCLKNYCECYEAKILCSSMCKCVGCKNFQESPERKTLMHLADAAEVRVQQQAAAKTKLSSQIQDLPPRPPQHASGERLPYTFVTTEVAEATCSCLLAQAEENERTRQMDIVQERRILEECGRCLMQIIESANRTKV